MKVTIIIPNYNGKHFMEPCLQSLSEQTCRDFKVLVVDNASSDGSLEYMSEHYPDIEVISLKKNYGFSKAVNVGIEHSTTPYVILLNNDTTVDTHYVEEMIKAIEKSPRIFSVSSKMIQMYHPELIDSAGDLYTLMGWGVCRGTGRPVSNYTKADQIFTACAGAAIYRRNAFSKIGLFDENHFAYLEDIDVGYRAKIYGYKNTAAEKYAQDNGFEFIALDDEVVTGDSNQDGIVNVKDVTYLQRHLAGSLNTDGSTLIDETSKALFDCLDLNKDGKLTVADVTELQVYISTKG